QLSEYLAHLREHIDDYVACYRENYRQKKVLGLLDDSLPSDIDIEPRVEGLVVTGGYSQVAEEQAKALAERHGTRVQVMKNAINPF
ncbi:MAG: hypothetical protein FJ313_04995, partial [Gemmatimonadetes bacterium]|nr:hypothetical protein [Gemmatimonadota bacterium]